MLLDVLRSQQIGGQITPDRVCAGLWFEASAMHQLRSLVSLSGAPQLGHNLQQGWRNGPKQQTVKMDKK